MTSPLSPGVYVYEVPSAQKPIAGVGTNTVAFIGCMPDTIQIPERNEDFDPVLATLKDDTKAQIEKLQEEIKKKSDEEKQAKLAESQKQVDYYCN